MKRLLTAAALTLALALPTAALAAPSRVTLDIPEDTYHLNDFVPIVWTEGRHWGTSLWGHLRCYDENGLALEQYERLDNSEDTFSVTVTPSWDGTTPIECVATAEGFRDGTFRPVNGAEDTFTVLP